MFQIERIILALNLLTLLQYNVSGQLAYAAKKEPPRIVGRGERIVMNCLSEQNSQTKFDNCEWVRELKVGSDIVAIYGQLTSDYNERYEIDSQRCALTILQTQLEDSSKFICRMKMGTEILENKIFTLMVEGEPEVFSIIYNNQALTDGERYEIPANQDNVAIMCNASLSYPNVSSLTWTIEPNADIHLGILNVTTEYEEFFITNTSSRVRYTEPVRSDLRSFTCKFKYQNTSKTVERSITALLGFRHETSKVKSKVQNIQGTKKKNATCIANGVPEPVYKWVLKLTGAQDKPVTINEKTVVLDKEGTYRCFAKNTGSKWVMSSDSVRVDDEEEENDHEEVLHAEESYVIQKAGKSFTLACHTNSGNVVDCNWTRKTNNSTSVIVSHGNVHEEFDSKFIVNNEYWKGSCSLILNDAERSDTAEYECRLILNDGDDVQGGLIHFFVHDPQDNDRRIGELKEATPLPSVLTYKDVDVNGQVLYVPDASIKEIDLECISKKGKPMANISWDILPFHSHDIRELVQQDEEGRVNLTSIFRMKINEDKIRGQYNVTCRTKHSHLVDSNATILWTKIILPHPVSFVQMKVKVGNSSIELKCLSNGYPFPDTFAWIYRRCIDDSFVSQVFNQNRTLTVDAFNSGVFSCMTGNTLNSHNPDEWIESNKYYYMC